jgi:DNA invertase Pin-like site-specific DNA recombinase
MKTTAYLRISTDAQDEASQRQQIDAWATATGNTIAHWLLDRASGSIPWQKRFLGARLETAAKGEQIVVSEISRIARSTVGVLTFLQEAAVKKVTVIAVQNKLALDDSMHSKITVTVLALAAEIERDLLRARTKAALDARRAAGLPMGRPVGSRGTSKLDAHRATIDKCLDAAVSKRAIARMIGCSPTTLHAWLEASAPAQTEDTTP